MTEFPRIMPEEIEQRIKEYDKTHSFPSCTLCRNKQITVLKSRKHRGTIIVIDSTEKCKLKLDFTDDLKRATKCVCYEHGDNEYIMKKKGE